MAKNIIRLFILLFSFIQFIYAQDRSTNSSSLKSFDLSEIKLLEGPFLQAQQTDYKYIMNMDVDRLLAPFLVDAGFEPVKPNYDNWEGSGLNGHIGGHYLSALSMMYAATGNDSLKLRLEYMIDWLEKCQKKNGNGYVGGIPDGKRIWNEISNGDIRADYFSLNSGWVPIYNIHKLFAGLRDAYVFTGSEKALEIWTNLSDWWLRMMDDLSNEQIQQILKSEHGGINEVFADLYYYSGNKDYLNMAEKLSHQLLLQPLIQKHDSLTGMHANTQIPKVVGFQRIGELDNSQDWMNAAAFFWETVVDNRSISIGGNSVREHFHPSTDFSSMITSEQGPETCNTYNMLRLSKKLFLNTNDVKYIDFYERGLYNHILSSQHPDGGFVYFTPMRPRHYRVYSQPQFGMWCCVGSGLENHAKYGELIYAHNDSNIFINLFIPSRLEWKEKGIVISQNTQFPNAQHSSITLEKVKSSDFGIGIRIPSWVDNTDFEILVNDQPIDIGRTEHGYATIRKTWRNGDKISVQFRMKVIPEIIPDKSDWYSFIYGPIVLAAKTDTTDLDGLWADDGRMSHVAHGKFYPIDQAPMLVGEIDDVLSKIEKNDSENLSFSINSEIYPDNFQNLELVPFYKIHEARYMIYWPITDTEGLEDKITKVQAEEEKRLALNAITIDYVSPGEQQPESDHGFQGEQTRMGYSNEKYWRSGRGWFSYQLKNSSKKAKFLRISYFSDQRAKFIISVENQPLKNEVFSVMSENSEITKYFELHEIGENFDIHLEANENSYIPRITDVRIVTEIVKEE